MPVPNSTAALLLQAAAWSKPEFDELRKDLRVWMLKTRQQDLWLRFDQIRKYLKTDIKIPDFFIPKFLGKLGCKEEPGKVRVFAMVDW